MESFYETIKLCEKVLVLDLGFLGDTIHLIPALRCIREAIPSAQLHVMVGEHVQSIIDLVPWVDRVLGYPRYPKGPKWYQDFGRIQKMRKENYDVVINLNGSDRSSILTRATGAGLRLGRVPPKVSLFWKFCFTHTIAVPYHTQPLYLQRLECLKRVGFPTKEPSFNIQIPDYAKAKVNRIIGLDPNEPWIHMSPFTTKDSKQLPQEIMVKLIDTIQAHWPKWKLVLSCAPNEREKKQCESLLSRLKQRPYKVFSGELNLVELAALMERSSLHISGDTGSLHIAFMLNLPTVSWFKYDLEQNREWMPYGSKHKTLTGEEGICGLEGVGVEDIISKIEAILHETNIDLVEV